MWWRVHVSHIVDTMSEAKNQRANAALNRFYRGARQVGRPLEKRWARILSLAP